MTHASYALMKSAAWWQFYIASQPLHQRYFTVVLYRKSAVTHASAFQLHEFASSDMGRHYVLPSSSS